MQFELAELHLQRGDIITSKAGMAYKGTISEKVYVVKTVRYMGGGLFEVIGWKEELIMDD